VTITIRRGTAQRPRPPQQPKPRKPLWTVETNGHTYRCELLFHEQGGTEAQILKDGELMFGRRFEEGWQTLQWVEEERQFIEKGGDWWPWMTNSKGSVLEFTTSSAPRYSRRPGNVPSP
jgi:hypothetical protein